MNALQQRHPIVLLLYYSVAITTACYTMHPLILFYALCGSIVHVALLTSLVDTLRDVSYYSVYALLITFLYSLFSHNGVTPLFFYNDNAVTLQAIAYGATVGGLFLLLVLFMMHMLRTVQTNHLLYVVTAIHPQLALSVVLAFRFLPHVYAAWQAHSNAQKGAHYFATASRADRIGRTLTLAFHVFMRTVEDSFAQRTALMQKGYAKQRTQFQRFRWTAQDTCLVFVITVAAIMLYGTWTPFLYYPTFSTLTLSPAAHIAALLLYALPAVLEGKEQWSWYYARRNI